MAAGNGSRKGAASYRVDFECSLQVIEDGGGEGGMNKLTAEELAELDKAHDMGVIDVMAFWAKRRDGQSRPEKVCEPQSCGPFQAIKAR